MKWEAPPQTFEEIVESVKSSAEKLERSLRRHAPEYIVFTSWADYYPIRKAFDAGELPKRIKDVLQVKELVPGQAVLTKYIPPLESMEFRYDPN